MTTNDLKVSLTSASRDRRNWMKAASALATAASARSKSSQGVAKKGSVLHHHPQQHQPKGKQQEGSTVIKSSTLLAEWKASVGGARNLPPSTSTSSWNGAVMIDEKRDDTENNVGGIARSTTHRQGAEPLRSSNGVNDDASFSMALAEHNNHNSCEGIMLDSLLINMLEDDITQAVNSNNNNSNNNNDCCFVHCGTAVDKLDNYRHQSYSSHTEKITNRRRIS
jgi:hypothetical protein